MKNIDQADRCSFPQLLASFLPKGTVEMKGPNEGFIIHEPNRRIGVNIIGAHGLAGSGKDTLCNTIGMVLDTLNRQQVRTGGANFYTSKKISFADPLKRACSEIFGIDAQDFSDRNVKEVVHPYWNLTPRRIAQLVGTEAMREGFDKQIWIHSAEWTLIRELSNGEIGSIREKIMREQRTSMQTQRINHHIFVFFSDVRFENEADWIREIGGRVIHITRNGNPHEVPKHASEAGIEFKEEKGDFLIRNNTNLSGFLDACKETFHELYLD